MLDRYEKLLKIACLILGALLLVQIVRVAVRQSPVAGLNLPAIPRWIERTNSPPKKETNAVVAAKTETNSPSKNSTNIVVAGTNAPAQTNLALVTTNSAQTNSATNTIAAAKNTTNSASKKSSRNHSSSGSSGGKSTDLPPLVQDRIDRVLLSETFGSLPHPVPMSLLGIAGDDVFLRTSSGQTGMIKEGGELDGVKLVKIGINRVLVESDGEKKELMIFSGAGGESLLSKEKEKESTK